MLVASNRKRDRIYRLVRQYLKICGEREENGLGQGTANVARFRNSEVINSES